MSYELAVSEIDYTPTAPPSPSLWMSGWGWDPRGNSTQAKARPLNMKCLVLYDDGVPNVIVSIDVISLPRMLNQRVRQVALAEGLVQSPADLVLFASHTHSGPTLPEPPDPYVVCNLRHEDVDVVRMYGEMFIDQLLGLIRSTRTRDRVPVTASYGVGRASFGWNRVYQEPGPFDNNDVPVLAFQAHDGKFAAVVFGYSCHAIARGRDATYDSDWPGFAAQQITAQLGCPALFVQGTAGDRNPAQWGSPDLVVNNGQQAADAVLGVVNSGALTPIAGPLAKQLVEIQLPMNFSAADPAELDRLRQAYVARLYSTTIAPWDRRHASQMLGVVNQAAPADSIPLPVQRWRFGTDLTLLAMGGEVVSQYTSILHAEFPSLRLWTAAYANEVPTYIPSDEILRHVPPNPDYESGWDTDPTITGSGSGMLAYGWPAPFRGGQDGVQDRLLTTCRQLLS